MPADFISFDEALEIALADISNRFPGADISIGSVWHHFASVYVTQRMGASGYAKGRYNATRPDLAVGQDLDELAGVFGLERKAATTAYDITGTVPVTTATGAWAAGLAMTNEAGQAFETLVGGSWTGSPATVTLRVNSTTTGINNNLAVGSTLTITAPGAGMESTFTVTVAAVVEAIDEESDAQLQQRLSDYMGGGPTSGNEASFWAWTLDEGSDREQIDNDFVAFQEAYIYPQVRGVLTVEAVPLIQWDGTSKAPAAGAMTVVEDYVDTVKTIGIDYDAVVVTEQNVAFRVTLTTDTGYGRDWGTSATDSLLTAAATHTTTRVFCTTDPALKMSEGDRFMIHIGTNYHPNVRIATAINSVSNYIDISEPFTDENGIQVAPDAAGGQDVRPAGPISQACVDAVLALFGTMTPSDTSASVRFPLVDQNHPEDLTDAMVYRALLDASDNILDITINTGPVAATTATLSGGVLVAYIITPNNADDWLRIEFNQLNT